VASEVTLAVVGCFGSHNPRSSGEDTNVLRRTR